MFKKSLQSFTPSLPLVTDCGWKIEDGVLVPIMTDMLPALEVAIDLVTFKCKKSCLNKRFACLKNGSKCTDAVTAWIVKIKTKDLHQYKFPLMMSFKTVMLLTNSSV